MLKTRFSSHCRITAQLIVSVPAGFSTTVSVRCRAPFRYSVFSCDSQSPEVRRGFMARSGTYGEKKLGRSTLGGQQKSKKVAEKRRTKGPIQDGEKDEF